MLPCAPERLDTADIVREGIFRQATASFPCLPIIHESPAMLGLHGLLAFLILGRTREVGPGCHSAHRTLLPIEPNLAG